MELISESQTIMIIEDSDDDFDVMIEVLMEDTKLKNPIVRCEDGQQAMNYLYRNEHYSDAHAFPDPGLIILDLNLPGVDGRKLLQALKSDSKLARIPIVVLTTSASKADVVDCYDMGANSYIQKPVDYHEFVAAILQIKNYWFEVANLPGPQW